ncbi:MAG: divalent-cation tolerance protein CutA [Rhodospirillales bacterium]
MTYRLIYVTCETRDEALKIGRAAVRDRLAACANVLGESTSIFRWEGAVQEASETVLVLKTRADLVAELTDTIKTLHGYTCPCVVALPIDGGNDAFLDWIGAETGTPEAPKP